MIRNLRLEFVDKVIESATAGTLEKVSIYKNKVGKNKGAHIIDFIISDKNSIGHVVDHSINGEFIRSIRQIRQHIIDDSYDLIDLTYVVDAKHLNYRIIAKK